MGRERTVIVPVIRLPLGFGLNRDIYLLSVGGQRCQPRREANFFFDVDELPVLRADNVAKQCQVSDAGQLSQQRYQCSRCRQRRVDGPNRDFIRALSHP
jgi:hypothetical protein